MVSRLRMYVNKKNIMDTFPRDAESTHLLIVLPCLSGSDLSGFLTFTKKDRRNTDSLFLLIYLSGSKSRLRPTLQFLRLQHISLILYTTSYNLLFPSAEAQIQTGTYGLKLRWQVHRFHLPQSWELQDKLLLLH